MITTTVPSGPSTYRDPEIEDFFRNIPEDGSLGLLALGATGLPGRNCLTRMSSGLISCAAWLSYPTTNTILLRACR